MPRYVVLVNWTDQGIRNVKQTIERTDHGGDIAEKHGLKLVQAYWTVGAYDMVAVFEAPDDEAEGGADGAAARPDRERAVARPSAEGRRDDRLVEVAGGDLVSFPPLGRVVER